MNLEFRHKLSEAQAALMRFLDNRPPDVLVVLGSGFKAFAENITVEKKLNFKDIPYMPVPQVHGHGSDCLVTTLNRKKICVLTGRVHLYEGYSAHDVVFAVRAFGLVGTRNVILTNAAGGLTTDLSPGEIVIIRDHINLTGVNCLAGDISDLGERFIDMNHCYQVNWREQLAETLGLRSEVYISVKGPTYETPAETKMFRLLGGGVIGMSTVQECIAARQLKMNVLGLSFVTNLTGGLSLDISHQEVLDICRKNTEQLVTVLRHAITTAP